MNENKNNLLLLRKAHESLEYFFYKNIRYLKNRTGYSIKRTVLSISLITFSKGVPKFLKK